MSQGLTVSRIGYIIRLLATYSVAPAHGLRDEIERGPRSDPPRAFSIPANKGEVSRKIRQSFADSCSLGL
jgi:hypothetical protein